MNRKCFAAVFVPDFPVQALARAAPQLREQVVAVMEGTPPLLHVAACNHRAREAGVEIGMTQMEAEAQLHAVGSCQLAVGSPTVQPQTANGKLQTSLTTLKRRSPAQEAAAGAALLDCACAFSPRVEAGPAAPDLVVLDLAGLERVFGAPATLARALAHRAAEVGLEANVAVAGNIETAIHAARGFAGLTIITPGEEAARIGELPVEVLLGSADHLATARTAEAQHAREILNTLARWSVRTFRALAALPETALRQRLGEAGARLQKLARGEGSRPLVPVEPACTFEEVAELEYPLSNLEQISFWLSSMLDQLCARLAARALAAQEIRLSLSCEPAPVCSSQFGRQPELQTTNCQVQSHLRLPVPMLDAKVFLKLLQMELEARPPHAPVQQILLSAEPAHPRSGQGGLFLPQTPEPEKLELMLARIEQAVASRPPTGNQSPPSSGELASGDWRLAIAPGNSQLATQNSPATRVGAAEILDSHRPDAFRMKPFSRLLSTFNSPPTARGRLATHNSSPPSNAPLTTALRRFRPPLLLQVEAQAGRPKSLRFAVGDGPGRTAILAANCKLQTVNCVLWAAGPWRESGEWWTNHSWSRQVWDIALQAEHGIAVYRIFYDDLRRQWLAEGMYD